MCFGFAHPHCLRAALVCSPLYAAENSTLRTFSYLCAMKLELLAPARDVEHGVAAIDYGADALYVGAAAFGARAGARNSTEQIARLVECARPFGVRVYAAMNTLLFDHELRQAEATARELIGAGVDALIVQDMAYRRMGLENQPRAGAVGTAASGIEFHASTQMCNDNPAQVEFLGHAGFSRAILERGLSLDEIRAIRAAAPGIELECFVHGAICVGFSGRCFLSRSMGPRSGNRGDCMQACRLSYDLFEDGREILKGKHLLSPLDLDLSAHMSELVAAGVTSFKIEGRLKDMAYIKNVVGYYRQLLDDIIAGSGGALERASSGRVTFDFAPDPRRSFSRGSTRWMFDGSGTRAKERAATPRANFQTPKATGALIGVVERVENGSFVLAPNVKRGGVPGASSRGGRNAGAQMANALSTSAVGVLKAAPVGGITELHCNASSACPSPLIPGDGICFMAGDELRGTYINRVSGARITPDKVSGVRITPDKIDGIVPGTRLFRSRDKAMEDALAASRTHRSIGVAARFQPYEPSPESIPASAGKPQTRRASSDAPAFGDEPNVEHAAATRGERNAKTQTANALSPSAGGITESNHAMVACTGSLATTYYLTLIDEDGFSVTAPVPAAEPARDHERAAQSIKTQLAKTGDTIFDITDIEIVGTPPFLPTSVLNALRREALSQLLKVRTAAQKPLGMTSDNEEEEHYPFKPTEVAGWSPLSNVTNSLAERFYRDHGAGEIICAQASIDAEASVGAKSSLSPIESLTDFAGRTVMLSAYCLRRELGRCPKITGKPVGALSLKRGTMTYNLEFDCTNCRMIVIVTK